MYKKTPFQIHIFKTRKYILIDTPTGKKNPNNYNTNNTDSRHIKQTKIYKSVITRIQSRYIVNTTEITRNIQII